VNNPLDQVVLKVQWRIVPLLALGAFLASLDKSNMGMASIRMNDNIGLSPSVYGLGISLFFITYALCEIPSNLMLGRFGARIWLTRIMVSWGLVSAAGAFIAGPTSYIANRVLLGVTEAGYLPGAITLLSLWLPAEYRARTMSWFMLAMPGSVIIGGPLSAALLSLNGALGLAGWQWLLLVEGIPPLVLALVFWLRLRDRPAKAEWLSAEELRLLESALGDNDKPDDANPPLRDIIRSILNPVVLLFTLVLACLGGVTLAVTFWLPQVVKAEGLSAMQTGLISALPAAVGMVCMILWSRHSDRTGEKRWHIAIPAVIAGISLGLLVITQTFVLKIALITVAMALIMAQQGIFWSAVSATLKGRDRVLGIATINAGGTLMSFLWPTLIGLSKQLTGSFTVAFGILGGLGVCGGLLAVLLMRYIESPVPAET
jgi:ACS family tartrate transporter-like MFS transporter